MLQHPAVQRARLMVHACYQHVWFSTSGVPYRKTKAQLRTEYIVANAICRLLADHVFPEERITPAGLFQDLLEDLIATGHVVRGEQGVTAATDVPGWKSLPVKTNPDLGLNY